MVGCALSPSPLTALDNTFSVLGDPEDTVYRDYQDTYRKFVVASEAVTVFRDREARHKKNLAEAGQAAQVSLATALARVATVETQRDTALAESAESRARNNVLRAEHEASQAEIGRLQAEATGLKALTTTLGATLHAAQQAALRLTDSLHAANSRYQTALDAAHGANEKLVSAAAEALNRQQEELARRDAAVVELQKAAAVQQVEIARRAGWRWRLRPPWRRS
jgi:chromosome segregation ATPase